MSEELHDLTRGQFFAGNMQTMAGMSGKFAAHDHHMKADHGVDMMHAHSNTQTQNQSSKSASTTPSSTAQQSTQTPQMVVVCRSPPFSHLGSFKLNNNNTNTNNNNNYNNNNYNNANKVGADGETEMARDSPASSFMGSMRSRASMVGLCEADGCSDVDAPDRCVSSCWCDVDAPDRCVSACWCDVDTHTQSLTKTHVHTHTHTYT
jgi:hypothetical protein